VPQKKRNVGQKRGGKDGDNRSGEHLTLNHKCREQPEEEIEREKPEGGDAKFDGKMVRGAGPLSPGGETSCKASTRAQEREIRHPQRLQPKGKRGRYTLT